MNYTAIKQIGAWLFPAHAWTYNDPHDARSCEICGRTEEFDGGGGMFGSAWCYVDPGTRMAHVKPRPAPIQQPAADLAESPDLASGGATFSSGAG